MLAQVVNYVFWKFHRIRCMHTKIMSDCNLGLQSQSLFELKFELMEDASYMWKAVAREVTMPSLLRKSSMM